MGEHRNSRQVHAAKGAIDVVNTRQRQTALGGQTRFGRIETEAHGGLQRQADGVLATLEIAEKRGVKRSRIRAIGFLANGPALGALPERITAASVGRQTRPALGERGGVFARVDRTQVDALVGARDQFFFKRRPVERLLGGLAPIGGRGGGEIGKKRGGLGGDWASGGGGAHGDAEQSISSRFQPWRRNGAHSR